MNGTSFTAVVSCLLLTASLAGAAAADGRVFDVLPMEKVPFNWPEPPREGQPDFFKVAREGKAQCVIVHRPDAASEMALAQKLGRYLELATGARFELTPETTPVPAGMGAIHVGDTAAAKSVPLNLPDARYGQDVYPNLSGYLVHTPDAKTLVIRGLTPEAVSAGVVGFLRRYVGVEQYWRTLPGGLGERIPRRPTLNVPQVTWRDWPYWYSRTLSQARMFLPGKKTELLDFGRANGALPCGENYVRWLPPARYAKEHPEYYCLINGARRPPAPESTESSGWQPCVSNADVARIMAQGVIEHFRANPQAPGVNVSINDGGANCECDGCRAMDTPNAAIAAMSDRYVTFTNRVCEIVEKEFPQKRIVMLAYAAVAPAPLTLKPHRMILPVRTAGGRNIFAAYDDWVKVGARELGIYIHHDDEIYFVLPKADPRQMERRLRYAAGSGRARVFYMEAHSLWPTTGCVAYVTAELLWDPRQDVDALMDRYCKGLFGPAAEPMKRFHAALETGVERWTAERGEPHWFGKEISPITAGRSLEQFRVLSVEEAARAAAALAEAKAAAQTDPLAAKHVEAVALCFGLQHLAVREYWTADRLRTAQVKSEADASRVVEDARALMALRREAADYVANVLGVAPANGYNLFGPVGGRHVNVTYGDMASREPLSAYLGGMTAGMDAASGFLRRQVGPEQAGAWWRRAADAEKEPVLVKAMRSAELHARGVQLQNLVASPGFEEAGKKFGPTEVTPGRQLELAKEQYGSLAVRLWFPERSPFRILLQQNDVHGGEYALTFQGCQRARYDFMAKAEPNARYRVGFWAKCAEGKGSYSYEVFGRAKAENKNVRIGGGPVPCDTTDWQHVAADVETPADCSALLVFVYVNGQAQDARFVIDDQFIGKYP